MKQEVLYSALYCPCIHESSYGTLSIHRTKQGAEDAVEIHIAEEYANWRAYRDDYFTDERFSQHEDWDIGKIEIQE